MSFKFMISFAIGIGVYIVGMLIFGIIKHHIVKKKVEEDLNKYEKEYKQEHKENVD